MKFRQIIINLLNNSIDSYKNSVKKNKSVLVVVAKHEKTINLQISDFGLGIPPHKLKHIFEPFFSTKADGSGIGLFIVRQIVEQDFDGKISVSSKYRHGTTFKITLAHKS